MFVFPLAPLSPLVPFPLNYFIVIFGHHQLKVFLVLSIILLFLMISHIMFGPFLYATNPTFTIYFSTFSAMSLFTSSSPLDLYNAIMVVNLTTLKIEISFFNTEFSYASPAPIPLHKMARPSVPFALLMTSLALYLFNLLCLRNFGLKPSTRLPISLTFDHPKSLLTPRHTSPYFFLTQTTPTFVSSVVSVFLTPTPLLLTNFHLALSHVST
jgi:hypothetical protein